MNRNAVARFRWGAIVIVLAMLLLSACRAIGSVGNPTPPAGPPLTATLTASPTSAIAGQTISFSFTTSAAAQGVSIPKATIDFGDGNAIDAGTGGPGTSINGSVSHSYASAGTFTVTFAATASDRGSGKATVTVSVAPKPPAPVLQIKADPASAQVGQEVAFNFSASGVPDNASAQLQLNYGDGAGERLNGQSGAISHTYSSAGSYAVVLSVTDAGGRLLGAATTLVVVGG